MQSTRCAGHSINYSVALAPLASTAPPHFFQTCTIPHSLSPSGFFGKAAWNARFDGSHKRSHSRELCFSLFLLLFHGCCSISYSYDRYESPESRLRSLRFARESLPVFQSRIDVHAGINEFRLCGGSIIAPARRRVLRAAFNLNISASAAANTAAPRLAALLSARMRLLPLRLLPCSCSSTATRFGTFDIAVGN